MAWQGREGKGSRTASREKLETVCQYSKYQYDLLTKVVLVGGTDADDSKDEEESG